MEHKYKRLEEIPNNDDLYCLVGGSYYDDSDRLFAIGTKRELVNSQIHLLNNKNLKRFENRALGWFYDVDEFSFMIESIENYRNIPEIKL